MIHTDKGGGDHIIGQGLLQVRVQGRYEGACVRFARHHIGDKLLASGFVLPQYHHSLLHFGILAQRSFNFPQFDTEPPEFDLIIPTPHTLDVAIRQIPSQVAGFVETATPIRVGREGLSR